jgi:alanyl-tRNA synthetase
VLSDEAKKFSQALDRGLHILYNTINKRKDAIDGKLVFDLYQSHGFPQELTLEILAQEGIVFSQEERKKFEDEFQKHKDLSRNWRGRMV